MKADSAPVQDTEGDGRSRRSPRDWWCLGWAWVVVAFIEIGGALRYGSGLQLVTGTATLVLLLFGSSSASRAAPAMADPSMKS